MGCQKCATIGGLSASSCLAAPQSLLSRGPTRGWNRYVTPAFSGVPSKGDKIRSGCLTPAFSGAHKSAELLCNPCILGGPSKGDKIGGGCLTLAFSGAHKSAELLCNPGVLEGPRQRGQNQKWLPNPCLLGAPQEGSIAT